MGRFRGSCAGPLRGTGRAPPDPRRHPRAPGQAAPARGERRPRGVPGALRLVLRDATYERPTGRACGVLARIQGPWTGARILEFRPFEPSQVRAARELGVVRRPGRIRAAGAASRDPRTRAPHRHDAHRPGRPEGPSELDNQSGRPRYRCESQNRCESQMDPPRRGGTASPRGGPSRGSAPGPTRNHPSSGSPPNSDASSARTSPRPLPVPTDPVSSRRRVTGGGAGGGAPTARSPATRRPASIQADEGWPLPRRQPAPGPTARAPHREARRTGLDTAGAPAEDGVAHLWATIRRHSWTWP